MNFILAGAHKLLQNKFFSLINEPGELECFVPCNSVQNLNVALKSYTLSNHLIDDLSYVFLQFINILSPFMLDKVN